MYEVRAGTLDLTFCDECEEFALSSKVSDHDETLLEYNCRSCKANWVEYE